jgi:hypothetical protein
LLPAFSINSVTGCLSTEILIPAVGSSIFGEEIAMPGIGPAIDGLSGVELLLALHAVIDTAAARALRVARDRVITFTRKNVLYAHRHGADVRNSSYRNEDLRTLETR